MTVLFADLSGLHRVRRGHGPRAGQVAGRPRAASARPRGRALRRHRRQVHRRQRHGAVRRPGGPRGRRRARRPRRARHAGRDGGDQRRAARGRGLPAASGREHGRGARGRGRRGLHGDWRHGERGLAASERGPAGKRDGGRADDALHRRRGELRDARAARAEGQGRAGAGLAGGRADRGALRAARRAGAGVPARGPPAGAHHARQPLRARHTRRYLPPRDGRRRGRRWEVTPAARVRGAPVNITIQADRAHRPLPSVRERHRLLGARRGAARGVRDRRVGLFRGGLGQAALIRG